MGYTIPQCFLDKIEIDKKLQDLTKGSVVSFMIAPLVRELQAEQDILREKCMYVLAKEKPDGSGRPTQMAVAA